MDHVEMCSGATGLGLRFRQQVERRAMRLFAGMRHSVRKTSGLVSEIEAWKAWHEERKK